MSRRRRIKYARIRRLTWRIITLGIAVAALVIALQNRTAIKWLEQEQDLMIEIGLFPDAIGGENQ